MNPGLSRIRGSLLVPGGGHHLVVEDPDGRHPEGQRNLQLGRVHLLVLQVRDGDQVQRVTGRQVQPGGGPRVDHGLASRAGAEHLSLQHLDPVDGRAQAPVGAREHLHLVVGQAAVHGQRDVVLHGRRHRRHLRQLVQRGEVGRVEPAEQDGHLAGVGPGQQPRIGGVGAPRARRRGEHHPAGQPEQQREADQRPPPAPHPGAQREPDRCHGQHSTGGPAAGNGGGIPRPVVLPAPLAT